MKKKLVCGLIAITGLTASAQETGVKQYGFWDNWFVQIQGGASYTFSENQNDADFTDLITPHAAISVGKYFSPQTGIRLQAGGWESKSYLWQKRTTYKYNYFQTNLDGILNLTNTFLPYKENRAFNLNAIMGVAYVHGFKKSAYGVKTDDYFVPRAGIQADLRMSNAVSLNLEVVGNLLHDNFNGIAIYKKYDATVNALVGLTYRFPQRGFKIISDGDPNQLKVLNDKLNERQSQIQSQQGEIGNYKRTIADLQNQLAQKPQKEVVNNVSKETVLNAVVVFRLGSAALEQNQEINIYNAAKYLKENPDVKVIVTGYADKSTGTAAINQELSAKRAQAVADILTNKYAISADRIKTEAGGDKIQPFETNEWNRVVVFTTDK